MNASAHRFRLTQTGSFFPKRIWPYLILLALGYYWSVVQEQRLLYTVLAGILLLVLLVRQKAASHCVLQTGEHTMMVHSKRGLFRTALFALEYDWSNLVFFKYTSSKTTDQILQLNWTRWEDTYFSGPELDLFCQYLRATFPEKEILPSTDP